MKRKFPPTMLKTSSRKYRLLKELGEKGKTLPKGSIFEEYCFPNSTYATDPAFFSGNYYQKNIGLWFTRLSYIKSHPEIFSSKEEK